MKKSARALIGLAVIDALVVAGTAWMVWQVKIGAWHAPDPAAAISTITSTAGGAVGIITALLLMASFVHRRRRN
jgi:hypothetical protein